MDQTPFLDYHIQEEFLFKNQQLCIPQSSLRLNLIRELHSGGLGGHCGMEKTTMLVKEQYFCPIINKDVIKIVECFRVFQLAKSRSQNAGLYTPLSIPERPWKYVSIDFMIM
jgi:hypothetical protein